MARPLLHPTKRPPTATPPGVWTSFQTKDQAHDVKLTEQVDRGRRGNIASVPTPWARVQLFRDAILSVEHPFHEEAVNDILDSLEVVLFQDLLEGVELRPRQVFVTKVLETAQRADKAGVMRFAEALRDLAPIGPEAPLNELTLVFNRNSLIFATSPYTIVVTPETRRSTLQGYYSGPRPIRPLLQRPPLLSSYVQHVLLPQVEGDPAAGTAEMKALVRLLRDQLKQGREVPDFAVQAQDAGITASRSLALKRISGGILDSASRLKPTRPGVSLGNAPLVVTSGATGQPYFPWLPRPDGINIDRGLSRHVLPGTPWKVEWIDPVADFLADRPIILDDAVDRERTYAPEIDNSGDLDSSARVLTPLTPRFFDFFTAADVPRLVTVRSEGRGRTTRVTVRLKVPLQEGHFEVSRQYDGAAVLGSHLAMWPGFKSEAPAPVWRDYYVVHHLAGADAGTAVTIELGAGGRRLPANHVQRDVSDVVYHVEEPPECVYVRSAMRTVGDEATPQGVLLPRLKSPPRQGAKNWNVAIDFGTSNTVVGFRADSEEAQLLELHLAPREGLIANPVEPDATKELGIALDTYSFPLRLASAPFGTVILKSVSGERESEAWIPAFSANVPFKGDIAVARRFNELIPDLKWGGGGADSDRLTTLFLHQLLQMIYAEAIMAGIDPSKITFSWSYPTAFSKRTQERIAGRWKEIILAFERNRLGATGADEKSVEARLRTIDESTAAMRYFATDPVAQGAFHAGARFLKLTADVGGGTTDVAAYANSQMAFRFSVLFGGQDLVTPTGPGIGSIFDKVYSWAERRTLPQTVRAIVQAYPTSHSRFSYLVRHPWFIENRGTLAGESWFPEVQACIAYFFSAACYNIGLALRNPVVGQGALAPGAPDSLFFGGNGSSYLEWLTEFRPWNTSQVAGSFGSMFKRMIEAASGTRLNQFKIMVSSQPKREVVLGMLAPSANEIVPASNARPPSGENLRFLLTNGEQAKAPTSATEPLGLATLGDEQVLIRHQDDFGDWEISRFHTAFQASVADLGADVDPEWTRVANRMKRVMSEMDEHFFANRLDAVVHEQIRGQRVSDLSMFSIEAAIALATLQDRLLAERG